MITFYILAYAGWVISVLLNIATFNRSTPDLSIPETIGAYIRVNWVNTITGAIAVAVVVFLTQQGEGLNIGEFIDTKYQYTASFLTGLGIEFILMKLRGLIKPLKIEENNN